MPPQAGRSSNGSCWTSLMCFTSSRRRQPWSSRNSRTYGIPCWRTLSHKTGLLNRRAQPRKRPVKSTATSLTGAFVSALSSRKSATRITSGSTTTKYPGREREVLDFYQKNSNALATVRAPIYEEKVVDFIVELADVVEKKVTKEELFKEYEVELPAG